MMTRVGFFVRLALWWLFAKVVFPPRLVTAIRDAASRGRIVYVLQHASAFDQLYFNYVFLKQGLPLARWSNGPSTVLLRPFWSVLRYLFTRGDDRLPAAQLASHVSHGQAALVCLERVRFGQETDADSVELLSRLVELEAEEQKPILLVPLMVVWERRNVDAKSGLVDAVFGTTANPGLLRRLYLVLKNAQILFFQLGAPHVQVGQVLACGELEGAPDERARALRERLLQDFEREREVVVGPRTKPPRQIRRELLADPEFRAELARIAVATGSSEDVALRHARRVVEKISSEFSLFVVKIFCSFLYPVWNLIYDGLEVDEEGLEKIRTLARDHRLIIIPSHKSHIDYLIVSYLFYRHGLIPPHITAGDNLDFPPVGRILRGGGAFFIRRQFKGDQLYTLCLRSYIAKILAEGHNIEFFIEGGRSRTGKLLPPKYGILRMILDAYWSRHAAAPGSAAAIAPLKIVPCSVTYERLVEAKAHHNELVGGTKKSENIGALLRSTQILTSRYGRLYVAFGEPIDVDAAMRDSALTPESPADALMPFTGALGRRVVHAINSSAIVTPSALMCLVLLNNPGRGISRARLLATTGFVLNLLRHKGIRLSPTIRTALATRRAQLAMLPDDAFAPHALSFLADPQSGDDGIPAAKVHTITGDALAPLVDEAIKLFSDGSLLELTTVRSAHDGEYAFYSVPEKARGQLAYYKNMILHAFVPDALCALALSAGHHGVSSDDELRERVRFLATLLRHEFLLDAGPDFDTRIEATLDEFARCGWVQRANGATRCTQWPSPPIEYLRNTLLTFVEAYALVLREQAYLAERWVAESDFVEHLLVACQTHYHEGRVRFLETLAKPTFENAAHVLVEDGICEQQTSEKRKKTLRSLRLADAERGAELATRVQSFLRREPR